MTKREREAMRIQHRDMTTALLNLRDLVERGYIPAASVMGSVVKNHVDFGLRWWPR